MKICDLHTHVLHEVDDGAQTLEYALEMLRNAVASDVTELVVTPHCNSAFGGGNFLDQNLQEQFLLLKQAAKDVPIRLMLGAEARVNSQLQMNLMQKRIPTLNESRYLLTEFASDTAEADFLPALQDILSLGYIPLIAHPERYAAVCSDPNMVEQWLDMGCHIQLTGGSVLGEYGKAVQRTATYLLKQDLVACVASDAHGTNWRSNFLLDVYNHLAIHYSKQYAACLLWENPMRICHDEEL